MNGFFVGNSELFKYTQNVRKNKTFLSLSLEYFNGIKDTIIIQPSLFIMILNDFRRQFALLLAGQK